MQKHGQSALGSLKVPVCSPGCVRPQASPGLRAYPVAPAWRVPAEGLLWAGTVLRPSNGDCKSKPSTELQGGVPSPAWEA